MPDLPFLNIRSISVESQFMDQKIGFYFGSKIITIALGRAIELQIRTFLKITGGSARAFDS